MRSWPTYCMALRRDKSGRVLAAAWGLFVLSVMLNVCLGAVPMGASELWQGLTGQNQLYANILYHARLPRAFGAVLAGGALAAAGVIIQSVLNNPLAGPNIIGINSGAGFAAVVCCAWLPGGQLGVTAAAFFGALLSTLLIYTIARRGGASRITLVLAGMAVNYIMNAGTDAVISLVPDAVSAHTEFRLGSLRGLTVRQLVPAAVLIALALLGSWLLCHEMDMLRLGEDMARSLGLAIGSVRFVLLLFASALAGAAVSFSGLLGFVGLIVPHAARFLVGEESRRLLPVSVLLGAAFLALCDMLARVLFAPFELPVGVVMAFLGAPFFIWLLLKRKGGRNCDHT